MENSHIAWTDHTFNPWGGCQKVSDGCKFCYAEALRDGRFGKNEWGPKGTRTRTSEANWRKPLQWNAEAARLGIRYKVFCASLADVFEENPQLIAWRADLFNLIRQTPNFDWQILTKRPHAIIGGLERAECYEIGKVSIGLEPDTELIEWLCQWRVGDNVPPNVWLGISAENQETYDERWPFLRDTPAAVRFVSYEPALGPLSIIRAMATSEIPDSALNDGMTEGIEAVPDWLICGGESGPNARPFDLRWARSIRDECEVAGVAFFMKQLGAKVRNTMDLINDKGEKDGTYPATPFFRDPKGGDMSEWPEDLMVRQFPEVTQ